MKRIRRGELANTISSAHVEYLSTGEVEQLTTKGDSNCLFFTPFVAGTDEVAFRLDWSDLDANGHPTLDADFYNIDTGKKRSLQGARLAAHHTTPDNPNLRIYEWEFQECSRPFRIVLRWVAKARDTAGMRDSVLTEVIRDGVKLDN